MNRAGYIRWGAWLLVGLWAALWAIRVGVGDDLVIRDQERQCAYILDVQQNGRWASQTDAHADMASKPPLYNWLGAVAVMMTGPGYFTYTTPAAVSTLLLALLAWQWARRLWGDAAGLVAGVLMLLPMVGPKMIGYVRTDGLFSATVALTAYAWWRHWERGGGWWWPWIAALLATLTKGPLGLVLGSLGLLAIPWERRTRAAAGGAADAPRSLSPLWVLGLLLYLLLAAGWLYWAWVEWGQPLVDRMIFRELVGQAVESHDSSGGIGSQFYKAPLYLLWRTAPWSFFTVLAAVRVFRRPDPDPRLRRAERFVAGWLLGGTLLFALASHQRGDLVWPLVLPSALLAAREIQLRARRWPQWTRTWLGPALVALALVFVGVKYVSVGQPNNSLRAGELARLIASGPGRDFPLSYDVRYTTQALLGVHRYYARPASYLPALAEAPALFVAVADPAAVVAETKARGGDAHVLIQGKRGWGVVGNRSDWQVGDASRLIMGPLDIVVSHAEWRTFQARRIRLAPRGGGTPGVVIANSGPYREPFVVSLRGATDLAVRVRPSTRVAISWRAPAGWSVIETPLPVPTAPPAVRR